MITIILLTKLFLIGWFITEFQPLQSLLDIIASKLYFLSNNQYYRTIIDSLFVVTGCLKCILFWLTLIVTLSPLHAILLSFIGYTYKQIIGKK